MSRLSFQKQVFTGFAVSLILVFAINYLSYKSTGALTADNRMVIHSQEVINRGYEVYMMMLAAESGQRGYVITGSEAYLEPYRQLTAVVNDSIASLAAAISDNPSQVPVVDSLRIYALAKIAEMDLVIGIRREKGYLAANERVSTDKGKVLMSNLREQVKKLRFEEFRLLEVRQKNTEASTRNTYMVIIIGGVLVLCILLLMFVYITRTFRMQREAERQIKANHAELEAISTENISRNWLLSGSAALNEKMRGEHPVKELSDNIIKTLALYLDARMGALFVYDAAVNELVLTGTYAYGIHQSQVRSIRPGEGLVGQSMLDKNMIVHSPVPEGYVKIRSGLGESLPAAILVVPLFSGDRIQGVIELGFSGEVDPKYLDFMGLVGENVAIAIQSAKARAIMQQQAEELQAQQEELQQTNEELTVQTNLLQASEEELRVQQEELQQTNVELEEKAALLEEKNQAVEEARLAIVQKAAELEQINRYKSEFLANMSHELRTPLNSILILARMLSANKNGTLLENEVKFASVIYNSGNDLLTLINDILDLSKIESGKLDLNFEEVSIAGIGEDMRNMFAHVAENKKIRFTIQAGDVPKVIHSDKQRLEQVLRNLLSNAFKFTQTGGNIVLDITGHDGYLHLAVKDTGIGIPPEKQQLIFEAFQQADGTTSRKYGGTGLGLSISRELAGLLGGEIRLESQPGEGSTFTLVIPYEFAVPVTQKEKLPVKNAETVTPEPAGPDTPNEILIVEDDLNFAHVLREYAEEKGFSVLLAHDGEEGLRLAALHRPQAILLDVMLPVMSGWEVLKKLKEDPGLARIPVHIMSADESYGPEAELNGALSFVEKPVSANRLEQLFLSIGAMFEGREKEGRNALIIEDNELESSQLAMLMKEQGMHVSQAYTGKQGLEMLDTEKFDFVVLDLRLPDMDGLEVLRRIKSEEPLKSLPVFINTAMDIPQHVQSEIIRYSNAFVVKNKRSNERLMDEIRLFVSTVRPGDAAPGKVASPAPVAHHFFNTLRGKKVLLADDDMRNVFALSSVLQQHELEVEIASNGAEALEKLQKDPGTDLVLMDIMMPEMDGYEAMTRIRRMPGFKDTPIIALTAKAMKNDREKCMEAGASDYLPKPVDTDKLLSMMKVWLSR